MFHPNFSVYLGQENEQGFIGFCAENGFFAILEIDVDFPREKGRELLKRISAAVEQISIGNLNEFETFLINEFKQADIPSSFSCAAGFVSDGTIWLKTVGTGQIYLRRGKEFNKLIEGENSASGYLSAHDFFVFTTRKFAHLLGSEIQLKDVLSHRSPPEVLEVITPRMKKQDDVGMIALFLNFEPEKFVENEITPETTHFRQSGVKDKLSAFLNAVKNRLQAQDKRKRWTLIGLIIILTIFSWSVLVSYQHRGGLQTQKKLETTKQLISEELNQAEEVAFLNMSRAIALIDEAKKNLADLKEVIENPNDKNIQELTKLIADREKGILKKEEKPAKEYFDLSVENKNASGQTMSLDGENLAVLDAKGAVYLLSLTKKSLDRRSSAEIKNASLVAIYQNNIYVFRKGVGIIELSAEGKAKKVIDNDPDWKDIVAVSAYNGNLYLLDRGTNQIYKYLVAANGFSQKTPYLQAGQKPNFQAANSLAIDASVYVGLPRRVLKYVSGIEDSFNLVFPEEDSQITKIFTSKDVEKVYAWDKNKGAIYIISKSGTYERQINSPVFNKASDFVVLGKNAYALVGSKIYNVGVD